MINLLFFLSNLVGSQIFTHQGESNMSDSPEAVLAPTSPHGLGVPITPVVEEVSSAADPDPVKKTDREEPKEAIKKATVTGTAGCHAGTGSSSAAPAFGLPPRRTGTTSLSRPPQRSTIGINGATGTASNTATRRTVSGSTNSTTNTPPAAGLRMATTSGISRRTPAIASPALEIGSQGLIEIVGAQGYRRKYPPRSTTSVTLWLGQRNVGGGQLRVVAW